MIGRVTRVAIQCLEPSRIYVACTDATGAEEFIEAASEVEAAQFLILRGADLRHVDCVGMMSAPTADAPDILFERLAALTDALHDIPTTLH